jgi:pimeloyl-ACP methyl ester carboxylesterase
VSLVNTSAGPVDVVEHGSSSGPPFLFVHPFMTNARHWRKVVTQLDGIRAITPTFPLGSHATAMHPDADLSPPGLARIAIDLLDALGIERATLVGNDTGGAIAQIAAANHPDRVNGLVLTSCDAYDVFPPRMFAYLKVVAAIPGATNVLAQSMRVPGVTQLPIAFGWVAKRRIDRDVMKSYIGPITRDRDVRRDTVKVMKGLDPRYTFEAAERLRSFAEPALIAWGAEDRFFPRRLAERLAVDIPRAQLEIVPDARTFVPEDNPRALAELIQKSVGPA